LTAHGLIDTTDMYLRTIFELDEEGTTPRRARIAERLSQSGPTVSETVARMERDGLLQVADDRHLSLSATGLKQAITVMRKHRIAECLLVDVIGLAWEDAHLEACRWEHVISDEVELLIAKLLRYPVRGPYGNAIPGLADLGVPGDVLDHAAAIAAQRPTAMTEVAADEPVLVRISQIGEHLQSDAGMMSKLRGVGIQPGDEITLVSSAGGVRVTVAGRVGMETELPHDVAAHLFVVGP
jgi:DtxR family Mn-dependent transcriptional regulator